ncbi:hypothetical protein [Aeromonas veronii]|uniref:hypothetical protein n=1 Tax=Aeromonas TaxID=642 RepID=UPI00214DE3E2|nr:hypothetical protein [Aeromonas veronii]MCR3966775.1 hypothetical protein [Aeromonas veronii]MCR3979313.1 hypothetical protein [Aeromonas veronii]
MSYGQNKTAGKKQQTGGCNSGAVALSKEIDNLLAVHSTNFPVKLTGFPNFKLVIMFIF